MQLGMTPTQEPVMEARQELVEISEELRDVLVQLDGKVIDSRYVNFREMANRLE